MFKLLAPKYNQFDSFIERGKFLMAYRLTAIFAVVFLIMTAVHITVEWIAFLSYLAAFLISSSALMYLLLTRKYRPIFVFYAVAGTVLAFFGCNYSMTTPHYVDFLWMVVASLLAFVGVGRRWGLIALGLNGAGSFYFLFFNHNVHLDLMQPFTWQEALLAYLEVGVAFFAIGYIMYQFIVFQNYSESKFQRANQELNAQNALILAKSNENSTLIKEIHHRVKNNLQIIISLLRLQQSDIKSEETKAHFTEAINRVMVMSSIHQRLYQEKEVARIDLKSYLTDLAEDLRKVFKNDKSIVVEVNTSYEEIDLKTVVPLGLLLNELISNSYKYAFEQTQHGVITIDIIEQKNDQFELTYADNGKWQQQSADNHGFGLDLINILAEQLNGYSKFETGEAGTKYHFKLSKLG